MIAQYFAGTVNGKKVHIIELSVGISGPATIHKFSTAKEAKAFAKAQGATAWNY